MDDENNDNEYENEFESILSEDFYNNESMSESIYGSIIRNMHSSQMPKFIVNKLFHFYKFNKNLENNIFNQDCLFKYETYYIIKQNWLWLFLYSYNYPKIFPIFESHKTNNYSDEIINKFHKIILDNNIKDIFTEVEFEEEENTRKILKTEEEFFPKAFKTILEDINININFDFYDDSVILDKSTYDEIKEDRNYTHIFTLDPKIVELCLIKDKKFIYKIKNNIFGLGIIYNQPDKIYFYLFKVLIILIIDDNIDYKEQFEILLSEKVQQLINHKKQSKNFNIEIIRVNTFYKKQLIYNFSPIYLYLNNEKNENIIETKGSEIKCNKEEMNIKESENKSNKEESKNKIFNPDKNIIHRGENNNNLIISNDEIAWDVNRLMSIYDIKDSTGDGNCLFNSFSILIFNNESYSYNIRQKICDFIREKKLEDDSYIENMRNNNEYGGELEINAFSLLCDIKITLYIRKINDINQKSNNDKIIIRIYNEHKIENFSIILDKYPQNERFNHFSPCLLKNGSSISNSKLQKIKEIFKIKNIYEDNNNSIICNDTLLFSFGDENISNERYSTLPNKKRKYSIEISNNFHDNKLINDSVDNFSIIKNKNDDKFKNKSKLHIGSIMSISYMNYFPKKNFLTPIKSNCSKGNVFLSTQINKNINNNSKIQNKRGEEENKIYNKMQKLINDNTKDQNIKKILNDYNKKKKKKYDYNVNKFLKMNERQENAKKKREEMEKRKNLKLQTKLENKNNLWKTKMEIDRNYQTLFDDQVRRTNK